tara:strand:+ start:1805 stop:2017 length:213 start_codon:yes stop_codon:yes gene_type:complete
MIDDLHRFFSFSLNTFVRYVGTATAHARHQLREAQKTTEQISTYRVQCRDAADRPEALCQRCDVQRRRPL